MSHTVAHFINGRDIESCSGKMHTLYNPASNEMIGRVNFASNDEVEAAIKSAKAALPVWSSMPITQRAQLFFKFKNLIQQHLDSLVKTICIEHGKTRADALGELQRGMEVVELACSAPALLKGEYTAQVSQDVDTYSVRQPLGICVGITPFNFPAMIGLWMYPLALVCGNTFILKPSEQDPSCSIQLAHLLKEAGLPDGAFNVVQGDKDTVNALITHPEVKAVSFVGSTVVARSVYQTAAAHGKRVQCGGSAKNIAVVMPDANLDQATSAILGAAYGSAGERCMAISVAIAIEDATANGFVKKLKPQVEKIKIDHGMAEQVDMGPLITSTHYTRVKSYIDLGIAEGAELIVDGRSFQHPKQAAGYYLGPCLFDKVQPHMRIFREEIFGPVLSVMRAPDIETAIQWISEHEYGNGAAIFTRDGYTAHEFAMRVPIGMVGINVPIPVPVGFHNFGGWKNSFFGDIGMYGMEGLRFYTQIKTITQRWPIDKAIANFNMPTTRTE